MTRSLNALAWLLAAALFLAFARTPLTGKIHTCHDLGWSYLPMRQFYARTLAAGDHILWMPSLFCGFYAHADGLVGMFHPVHFLLYKTLPLAAAFNFEFLLNYAFAFAGMLWLLRLWSLPQAASVLGAAMFSFSGFNLLHFDAPNAVAIMAHLPWLIGATERLAGASDARRRARWQAAISLLTGSQLLLGYPQYVMFSVIAETAFVLWRGRAQFPRWLAAKSVGGLIGMIQVLPTLDALRHSARSDSSLDFRLSLSLYPANLAQLWAPFTLRGRVFPWMDVSELGVYDGVFGTAALAWATVAWKEPGRLRPLLRAAAIFAAGSLVLALGRYGLVYPLLARLPLFVFHAPARHIALLHWAMAILAAISFAQLTAICDERREMPWTQLWPLAVPAGLGVSWAVAAILSPGPWLPSTGLDPDAARVQDGAALIAAACALTAAAARGRRWAMPALIVLIACDLLPWSVGYLGFVPKGDPRVRSPALTVEEFEKTIREPPDALPGRVGTNWASANALTMKGYALSRGYVTLAPEKAVDPRTPAGRRLAGVRWDGHFAEGTWDPIKDSLPRARLVAKILGAPPAEQMGELDLADVAWTEPSVSLAAGPRGTANIVSDRPGAVDVEVEAPTRQLLVVSESYHGGWRATVDGRSIPIVRAYGDYLGCVVESGSSTVEFRFNPASFIWGRRLSLVGLFLSVCSLLI